MLAEKHTVGTEALGEVKLHVTTPTPEPVIFENICAESVLKVAKNICGSGGPTHIDADGSRHVLCCKSYGKHSVQLCEAIAAFARIMATHEVDGDCLREFAAGRLVPLDKGNDKSGEIELAYVRLGLEKCFGVSLGSWQ